MTEAQFVSNDLTATRVEDRVGDEVEVEDERGR